MDKSCFQQSQHEAADTAKYRKIQQTKSEIPKIDALANQMANIRGKLGKQGTGREN